MTIATMSEITATERKLEIDSPVSLDRDVRVSAKLMDQVLGTETRPASNEDLGEAHFEGRLMGTQPGLLDNLQRRV